jgi:exosortase
VQDLMTKVEKHQAGLALLCAVTLLLGWRPLIDTLVLALHDDEFTYILLILPVSVALIYLEWRPLLRTKLALSVGAGCAFLATAALIACASFVWSATLPSDVQLTIKMVALVLSWIGAFVLCFGSRASRQVLFPLCFLFWMVPIPLLVLNEIIALLQQGSAWAAYVLFALFDIPVTQDGVVLTIPSLTLQVAQECSSIRSSSMLLVTTMVLAQLLLRAPWRKALVIGLAVPLSVAKNGLRVFTIAMLAVHVNRGYLTGRFHHQGGIVFFAIALIVIFGVLWILRRGENSPPASDRNPVKDMATVD